MWAESKQLTYKHYWFGRESPRIGEWIHTQGRMNLYLVRFWNLLQVTPELMIPETMSEVNKKSCDAMPPFGAGIVVWTPPDHCNCTSQFPNQPEGLLIQCSNIQEQRNSNILVWCSIAGTIFTANKTVSSFP